jgi:UDP:flavonoid glycosyltransferase YjiC (YdhE family)
MKILFTSTRGLGHLYPLLPLARAARDAGDDVRFAVPASLFGTVRRHGFAADRTTSGEPSAAVAALFDRPVPPPDPLAFVIREYWGDVVVREQLPHLQRILARHRPDLVVSELMDLAGPLAAEAAGIPHVPLGVNALRVQHAGLEVTAGPLNAVRRSLGLPETPGIDWLFRHRYLTPFPAALEHPALVRPQTTTAYRHQDPDGFAPTLAAPRPRGRRPRVYASLGTRATEDDQQLAAHRTVLAALGLVDAEVTFTVGGLDRSSLGVLPANVRLAGHLPPRLTMDDCDVVLTHAGAGTATAALSRGLPMVCVPLFGDQPHNARRVAQLGAGLEVPPDTGARAVAAALDAVLETPVFGEEARRVAASLAGLPTVADVVPALYGVVGAARAAA